MPRKSINLLTDTAIRRIKSTDKTIMKADGNGLYLAVTSSGNKIWRLKCRLGQSSITQTLGHYPATSLAEARVLRDEAMKLRAQGKNPAVVKRQSAEAEVLTFEKVTLEWHGKQAVKWSKNHAQKVMGRLTANIFPALGMRPITEITTQELLAMLRVVEKRSVETAHILSQICAQIFRYSIVAGYCDRNIAADLTGALQPIVRGHFAAVTEVKDLIPVLQAMWNCHGGPLVVAALKLTAMLAVRQGELRHMEWGELDLDEAIWSIPAEKMKMKLPHIVPLPTQAVEILRNLHPLSGRGRYVFPNPRAPRGDRPMSENAVRVALRTLGFDNATVTAHGFRATFRTIGAEVLEENPLILEAQLAHRVPDALGRAYNRTTYLPQRKVFMQKWADYLDSLRLG